MKFGFSNVVFMTNLLTRRGNVRRDRCSLSSAAIATLTRRCPEPKANVAFVSPATDFERSRDVRFHAESVRFAALRQGALAPNAENELSPASEDGRRRDEPMPNSTVIKLYCEAIRGIQGSFIPILRPNVTRIIYPRSRRLTNFIDEIKIPKVLSNKSQAWPLAVLNTLILT